MDHEDDNYTPLTETAEWKRARGARQNPPHGRHIRESPGIDGPIDMSRQEMIEEYVKREQEKSVVLSGIRFEKSISVGALGGILMTVIGWGAAWGVFTRWQGDVENKLEMNRQTVERMQKDTDAVRGKYIPAIDGLQKQVDMANNRLDNVGPNFTQLRDTVTDLAKATASLSATVSKTHEEFMVLNARLGYDKRTELIPGSGKAEGPR